MRSTQAPRHRIGGVLQALRHVFPKCTILGLDILDQYESALRSPTSTNSRTSSSPADADADALGSAQLLRHEPLLERTHARDPRGSCQAILADRDRRDREIRRRFPQRARRRPEARGESTASCSRSPPRTHGSSACTSTSGPAARPRRSSTRGSPTRTQAPPRLRDCLRAPARRALQREGQLTVMAPEPRNFPIARVSQPTVRMTCPPVS